MRRIDIFSDGVFAIAITLLVLELPFDKVAEGQLAHELGEQWGSFLAYAISFLGIGLAWMHHNAVFEQIVEIDRRLMLLNLLALMTVAFLPFPTALVGEYLHQGEDATTAMLAYSGTWTLTSLAMGAIWAYACRSPGVVMADLDPAGVQSLRRLFWGAAAAYTVFTLVALVSPRLSLALYGASAIFYLWRSDYRALKVEPTGAPDPPGT